MIVSGVGDRFYHWSCMIVGNILRLLANVCIVGDRLLSLANVLDIWRSFSIVDD